LNFFGSKVPFGQLYKHDCNGTRLQKSEEYPCDKQLVNDSNPSLFVVVIVVVVIVVVELL
jgi:hypothetical protein